MRTSYDRGIAFVFTQEGGYSNNAKDPGGPTNWGITLADARLHWKPDATAEDVRHMPKEVAAQIYREHYAKPIHFDEIAPGLDVCTLDAAVNSGVGRADKWLAKALRTDVQGYAKLGEVSQKETDLIGAIERYQATRLQFLKGLKTWPTFGRGWERRVKEGEQLAITLAKEYIQSRMPLERTEKPADALKPVPGKEIPVTTKPLSTGFLEALASVFKMLAALFTKNK